MRHTFGLLWSWFVMFLTNWLPDAPPVMRMRGWLLGFAMRKRGKDFQVASGVRLNGVECLSVANHVYLAPGVVVMTHPQAEVELDDGVMIGFHSVLVADDHLRANGSFRFGPVRPGPIIVGRGTWIAANCTVVSGVTVGPGSVVGANSVVTRDVPADSVVGGVPAILIKAAQDA